MDVDRLRREIQGSLLRLIACAVLHHQVISQRIGLSSSDSQFLSLLKLHGPLTAGQLAELSGLTTGTVTGVLDRLERAGYIRRMRAAADRRKVLVMPDADAMAALAEHYGEHSRHADTVLRRRDPEQLQVIADFLAELAEPTGSGRTTGATRA